MDEKLNEKITDMKIQIAEIKLTTEYIKKKLDNLPCETHATKLDSAVLEIEKTKRSIYRTMFAIIGFLFSVVAFFIKFIK